MDGTARFVSEEGVPTATVGEPVEPQTINSGLRKELGQMDAKLDLLLNALGVSTESLEENSETD